MKRGHGLLWCLCLSLSGCSAFRISVVANKSLNRDINGVPSPVALRLVHFQSLPHFLQASWMTLSQKFHGQTRYIEPNQVAQWSLYVPASSTYVGIVADFRQREDKTWKCYRRLPHFHQRWFEVWDVFVDADGLQTHGEGQCQS